MLDHDTEMSPLVVIISNRGPFKFKKTKSGDFDVERGSGGLVTALSALAERHDVLWVAAAMGGGDRKWAKQHGEQPQNVEGTRLRLVVPDQDRYEQYYNQIANPLLWFIQHQLWDVPRSPDINQDTWNAWESGYVAINELFADAVVDSLRDVDPKRPVIIFPQDYHLYLTPYFLRQKLGERVQIQPFVHIPWPGPDAWRILPGSMRNLLLMSLLKSDRIGFQTQKDAFNFVQTCRFYLEGAHSLGSRDSIHYEGRKVKAKAYPISIDIDKVREIIQEPQTELLKSQLISLIGDRRLILRVDRIEPSKNILRGLDSYEVLLETYPEYHNKVQMLALLVPSRMEVNEYQDYLADIMARAGLINAKFSEAFWEPVRIVVGESYPRAIAAMQLYDVLLVNPIADGMNLVAKEGVLVNQRDGVLVLSEYAGAFYELGEAAIAVSPFDTYGTAEAMHRALTISSEKRRKQAETLSRIVENANIKHWFYTQLDDALTASSNQAKKDSTSDTPEADKSAASNTEAGVPAESIPMPTA